MDRGPMLAALAASLALCACPRQNGSAARPGDPALITRDSCFAAATPRDGHRSLALLVAVGKYRSSSIPQLTGPANDVKNVRRLLVEQYGFPPENVCVLQDEQATVAGFEEGFEK